MRTKITYILSNINKAIAFEWIVENINKDNFDLNFILLNPSTSYLEKYLNENNIKVKSICLSSKKDYIKVFFSLFKELKKIKPDIVHTHLRDANLLGLFASRLIGVKKRIYTRHHSTYNHKNFPQSVKWDKFSNWLSTDIVAISENVKDVLIYYEKVKKEKIHLIHHGFDLDAFKNVDYNDIIKLKQKYINKDKYPIIGVVARYVYWKGHKYQIFAFKRILKKYPNAFFIFANATGPNKKEIQELLKKNLPSNCYTEIKFENNLFALYNLFDIYVHTPIDDKIEAFGQTYVEALASRIPSVFTLSGVANEFIVDKENAMVVDYKNSDQIFNSIVELLENTELKNKIIMNGEDSIKYFDLKNFIKKLEKLYE